MDSEPGLLQDYLNREQLARELGCTARTIHNYENQVNGLPSLMLAGKKMYRKDAVMEWLARREKSQNISRRAGK